jgi:hypothetical protein
MVNEPYLWDAELFDYATTLGVELPRKIHGHARRKHVTDEDPIALTFDPECPRCNPEGNQHVR